MTMPLPEQPTGFPVGTFSTYAEAQRAVDYLSDNEFPVENTTIVGSDLRLVEKVTGRLTRGRVIYAAALSGAMWGLLFGAIFTLFGQGVSLAVIPVTAVLFAIFGAITGALGYAATGGNRDFTSRTSVVATSYDVLCEPKFADDARQHLARLALRG
jgi:uncharacterized membrane protein